MSRFARWAKRQDQSGEDVVQLHLLSPAPITACQPLTIGWSAGAAVDAPFDLYILSVPAAESSSIASIYADSPSTGIPLAASRLKTVTLGQTRLADATFVWPAALLPPGRYIVNGTALLRTHALFAPTSPFTVEGDDQHCRSVLLEPQFSSLHRSNLLAEELASNSGSQTTSTTSNTGAIAGGAVAGVLGLLLLVGLAFYIWRRLQRQAPVALRPRSPILPSSGEGPAKVQISDTPAATPLPFANGNGHGMPPSPPSPPIVDPDSAPVSPISPATTRKAPSAWTSRPVTMYAESSVFSDDSFAEERAALRHEFGLESVGPGRRAYTSRESSVWSELPVGPDGQALGLEAGGRKPPRSLTFSVSNPDNTVWEDGEEPSPPPSPKR